MFASQEAFAQAEKTDISIVNSLFRREIYGKMLHRKPNPFGDSVPERLRMPTESILPKVAFQNGHIFLGFTNCNRYILSYTSRPLETFENIYSGSEVAIAYKLHFWLFTPYRPVQRVSSVILFDKNGVIDNNLLVQMMAWEGDDTRLIVTGRSATPEKGGHWSLFYVTVTSVPASQTCLQCKPHPTTWFQRDDDYLEDIRTRCILHGVTSHSVVDRVEPFPKFNPTVQLACKDTVLLNTGNAFHMLTYNSGSAQTSLAPPKKTRSLRCDFWFHNQPVHRLFSNCSARESARIRHHETTSLEEERNLWYIKAQELLLYTLPVIISSNGTTVAGLANVRRRASISSVDSDIYTDISVESSVESNYQSIGSPPKSPPKRSQLSMLPPTGTGRKFFKTKLKNPTTRHLPGSLRTNSLPSSTANTYDIFDVSTEEVLLDRSLSSYRRRRNADKEYEFSEPDSSIENIFPLTRSRARKGSTTFGAEMIQAPEMGGPSGFPRSPRTVASPIMSPGSEYTDILRPLTNNAVPVTLPAMSPNSGSDTSSIGGDWSGVSSFCKSPTPICLTPEGIPSFTTSLNCVGQVLRTYMEKEDDSGSVRTDTDDEYQSLAFPVALNLDVYACNSVELVSNSRIKSCSGPVFQVLQRTLDVELLCNEVSGMICLAADKHFSSCFDYDVAVVHVCPERGSVTALAFILIQATSLKFRTSSRYANYNTDIPPIPGIPDPRKKYEGIFSFVWEPSEDRARILYIGNLQEMETVPEKWHPTKQIVSKILPSYSETRIVTNELCIFEWQSLEEMKDSAGVVTLFGIIPTASSSPYCAYAFASSAHSSTTEDEDLSD